MTTHVTLTDVMVDELVARAEKAEAKLAVMERVITERLGDDVLAGLQKLAELDLPTEEFLQKVRAL